MLLASAAANTPSSPPAAPPAEAEPRVYGETVADARRLLKQANRVLIHYRADDRGSTALLAVSKKAFSESLRYQGGGDPMPCELVTYGAGKKTLTIGSIGAIYAARDAKEARDAAASR